MSAGAPADLVVLVADSQMEFALRGILTRGRSLQFREISAEVYAHPAKDPGCLRRADDFLRPFLRRCRYALVMLDREGCGRQELPRDVLEAKIEQRLAATGWKDRSAAIVLDPELEVWVSSDSPEVEAVLGWTGRSPPLAEWLVREGFLVPPAKKPTDPKRALDAAMRLAGKRRSSALFRQLAERVGLHRCDDPAFLKLKELLQRWFGDQ